MTNIRAAIEHTLQSLPNQDVAQALRHCDFPYSFLPTATVDELCSSSGLERQSLGVALLPLAAAFAVAPVSDFFVGAVAFDEDGNAYLGANFEFSDTHIGQVIHAEQSAIAHAWSCGASALSMLVISHAPCGHCRQFINEVNLSKDFFIVLPGQSPQPLSHFLPSSFGPADLGISGRVLNTTMPLVKTDNLAELAHAACRASHSPYSGAYSGVAVRFADGDVTLGGYAESAAFNPSLPPLQMALNYKRLKGGAWSSIASVVFVERSSSLSQKNNTQLLLQSIDDVDFIVHTY